MKSEEAQIEVVCDGRMHHPGVSENDPKVCSASSDHYEGERAEQGDAHHHGSPPGRASPGQRRPPRDHP
jgi:hypothetical protein